MSRLTELQIAVGCVQCQTETMIEIDDQKQELKDAIMFKEPTRPWLILANKDCDDFFSDGYLYEAAMNMLPQVIDLVYLEAARLAGEDLMESSKQLIEEMNK